MITDCNSYLALSEKCRNFKMNENWFLVISLENAGVKYRSLSVQ